MAVELATAYFSFLPSMAGTAAAAAPGFRALEVQSAASGARSGALMGGAVAGGLGKFVPIIGGVLAGIGVANFFSDAVNAASNLNESANAIKVSFGDAAGEVESLGKTAAERLGLSNNDFNSLAVRFSSFSRVIAGDSRKVGDVLDELTTRGADFASVYNIEAADALALFQSGLAGESEPLRRYGIDISAATVANTAYRLGIAETGVELTEQEKIQARYAAIMEQTAQVEGDRANTADQLANKQRENAAKFEDALARIGTALLPAATAFAQFVGSEENAARLERIVDAFVRAEPFISDVADFLLDIAETKFSELDTLLSFFAALEDGKLTLEEVRDIVRLMPSWMQGLVRGLVSFYTDIIRGWVGAVNGFTSALASYINTVRRVLGIPGTVSFGTVNFSGLSGKSLQGLPKQEHGGRTVAPGLSWVGENGPELAYMPVGATVIPNDISQSLAGGDRPIYSDTGMLIGWVRETANQEARLVWALGDARSDAALAGGVIR